MLISIHLMFLLILIISYPSFVFTPISIHLMFLLICICLFQRCFSAVISIHLMFLLIGDLQAVDTVTFEFQYISCFY